MTILTGKSSSPTFPKTSRLTSRILAHIIRRLYPPKSPYRFDVIGVELLGSIYERYLGNTIRLTPKQVKVEEKAGSPQGGRSLLHPQVHRGLHREEHGGQGD